MKLYMKWLFITALSVFVLGACNNDEDEVTDAPKDVPTEQEDDNGITTQTKLPEDPPFAFSSFSLDVDYGVNKNVEVDYESEASGVEASYDNDLSNEKLTGNEAYDKLEPIFKNFTFDATTANDEVIAEVLKAFDLQNDYKEVEIEIRYADGSEKEYKEVK